MRVCGDREQCKQPGQEAAAVGTGGTRNGGGGRGDIKKEKNEAAEVSWTTGLQNNFLREV